ncbi:MAG: hypothetical protein AAF555_05730 [Verrucomicrobiota bacterium]
MSAVIAKMIAMEPTSREALERDFPYYVRRGQVFELVGRFFDNGETIARTWVESGLLKEVEIPGIRWSYWLRDQVIELLGVFE